MKERRNFVQQLLNELELEGENLPGSSLVEIAGNQRVLVEKHFGVKEYTRERIRVAVSFGCVDVCGRCLELCHMNREQIIITGQINGITLHRRKAP